MAEIQPSSIPCIVVDSFSSCNLSNWDTMVIELSVGGLLALVFFYIQSRNTKLINMMLKGQFDYVVKDSINKLLWMENGLQNVRNYLQVKNFNKIKKILKLNSETIKNIKIVIDKHNDIAPQLIIAISDLKTLNDNLTNSIVELENFYNNKLTSIRTNMSDQILNDMESMTSIIKNSNVYNIKKHGVSPNPEYLISFSEKTNFQLRIPRIQTIISFVTGIVALAWIYPRVYDILLQFPQVDNIVSLSWIPVIVILLIVVFSVRFFFRVFIRF